MLYSDSGDERVGFVLLDDRIIELDNVAEDPTNGFSISTDDLIRYDGQVKASWHTHPGQIANLSVADYHTFCAWPHISHYVLGSDGIRCYTMVNGSLTVEDCSRTRIFE